MDVIVIGSGIGGLSAAALLAKSGRQVLVLEQHDRAGGYAHGFKRKKYTFDSGVHLTSGCGMQGYQGGQLIRKVLQAVNVYEQLEFIEVNPFSFVSLPELSVALPLSIDAFVKQLADIFPHQQQGLHDLLALCLQLAEQVAKAEDCMAANDLSVIQSELAILFQYRNSTLAEVWGDFIQDPQLQSIFAANWPYLGLPPEKVSFVYWASMLIGYLVEGAYYCKGGFQKLADALVQGIQDAGGDVRFKSAVTNIRITDNQVQGVELASGEFIAAKSVISNADMRHTISTLIGEQYFPKRYLSRLQRMQASMSIFVVYIATNLDVVELGAHHEAFYYDELDHELNYNKSLNGELSWLSITIPTLVDDSLAPKGEHLVVLTTLANFDQYEDWKAVKADFTQKMLHFADKKLPGLNTHVLFVDAGSPATMQRYTLNHKGAAYGWDVTPQQAGANRAGNKAPIDGLFFVGHWTTPGGGVYGVTYSGVQVAQKILGLNQQSELWDKLGVT
ncbi:MAG: FAD-dependent oxidoreductase [Methyloprofundus sp.]|nr:FAD-dependent oxidoreductase [Methyloprofundus sp.]